MKRLLAALLFLAGLAALIGLGTWQYQRLQWKTAIIATLEEQYAGLPQNRATLDRAAIEQAAAAQDRPFLVGTLSGRLLPAKAVAIGPRSINGVSGYDMIVPMDTGDGIVLANLGWMREAARESLSLPRQPVTLSGTARRPDYSRFTSKNSPAHDLWFQADIDQIAQARALESVAPLIFYAQDSVSSDIAPHAQRWLPRNKHRQYMFFWFGMAAAWTAVFALAFFKHQRQR